MIRHRSLAAGVLLLVVLAVLPGCTIQPRPSPAPTASFRLVVVPDHIADAVPANPYVVMVRADGEAGPRIALTARIGEQPVSVHPDTVPVGGVAEILVGFSAASINQTVVLTISGTRGDETHSVSTDFVVGPDPGPPPIAMAVEVRDVFVGFLATQRPELGITNQTQWVDARAKPNWLVVSYYVFYSDEWEMGVRWHIMIPPHDWAEVYLRHRYDETSPAVAYKVDSFRSEPRPAIYEPPFDEAVWR